jgi:cell pole-organizing protein PopZ
VLLDAVMHPRARERVAPLVAEVEARVRALAARNAAQYESLDAAARIEPGDFYDHTHFVTEAAMQRYQDALAERLVPLLRSCVQAPGAGCRP